MDTYITLKNAAEAQLTEKRSRFLAFALHVADENAVAETVAAYRRKYHDARHVCYAYALGNDAGTTRANDDGEPSGTAGRPILGQILSRGLTYTAVIVIRYFGGVKLGTGPLGVAYKTVAAEALDNAEKQECVVRSQLKVTATYTDTDVVMRFVREAGAEITGREYSDTGVTLTVSIRMDDEQALRERLRKIHTIQIS